MEINETLKDIDQTLDQTSKLFIFLIMSSSFLNELNGKGVIKKNKMRLPYLFNFIKPLSYFRANKYKNEALYLKKLFNIIH